jgi:hypothetical protein
MSRVIRRSARRGGAVKCWCCSGREKERVARRQSGRGDGEV